MIDIDKIENDNKIENISNYKTNQDINNENREFVRYFIIMILFN